MKAIANNATSEKKLRLKANQLRVEVLNMIYEAQTGHLGGSFSAVEILTVLYYHILRRNSKDSSSDIEDRFILSKGHAAPILYAILADLEYFPREELRRFRQIGSLLQGHPCRTKTPGIEASGSLGQGLSIGCGLAYSGKYLDKNDSLIYVLLGDGELNEGQIWEAAMFAAHYKLNNLIAIVDRNHLQYIGNTESVLSVEPLIDKWKAFGWYVRHIPDGHNISSLLNSFRKTLKVEDKPTVLIAETIKGKGVSFMENNPDWHGTAPNKEQFLWALQELEERV